MHKSLYSCACLVSSDEQSPSTGVYGYRENHMCSEEKEQQNAAL